MVDKSKTLDRSLSEIIKNLNDYSDDELIIVRPNAGPISAHSPAKVVQFTHYDPEKELWEKFLSLHGPGFEYFLEVEVAKEVVDVLREWRGDRSTLEQEIQAVIYYAENDAYLPLDQIST